MKNRFYLAAMLIHEVAEELLDKGFEQLDNACDSEFDKNIKILIDKNDKTFYFIDEESLEQANQVIAEKYKVAYKSTQLNKIKSWINN